MVMKLDKNSLNQYISSFLRVRAGVAQLVEHKLPKLGVAGSSPVARSSEGCIVLPPVSGARGTAVIHRLLIDVTEVGYARFFYCLQTLENQRLIFDNRLICQWNMS